MPETGVIVFRAAGSIVLLYLMTRILGKKQISQLTFFEYITGIVIGDLAGFMSTDIEGEYLHGVASLTVWFILPLLVEYLTMKNKKLRDWLEGTGTVFVRNGRVLEKNLKKERYTADELMEQLRNKGVFNPAEVEFAVLEPTGDLSVLLKEENLPLTPRSIGMRIPRKIAPQAVVMDGKILTNGLRFLELEEGRLRRQLENLGYPLHKVFLAVADSEGGLYVDLYKDRTHYPKPRRKIRRKPAGKA